MKEAIIINTCVRVYKRLISEREQRVLRLRMLRNISFAQEQSYMIHFACLIKERDEYQDAVLMYETVLELQGLLDIVRKLSE